MKRRKPKRQDYDGVTEINCSSRGRTELGCLLSTFGMPDDLQYIRTPHGLFKTIEGYWHYLGSQYEGLRRMSGYQAHQWAQANPNQFTRMPTEKFNYYIEQAVRYKIDHSAYLQHLLSVNDLPFVYYHISKGVAAESYGYNFFIELLNKISVEIKEKTPGPS